MSQIVMSEGNNVYHTLFSQGLWNAFMSCCEILQVVMSSYEMSQADTSCYKLL